MKLSNFSLVICLFFSLSYFQLNAQEVNPAFKDMGGVEQPGLIMAVEETNIKIIEEVWTDMMKSYAKKTRKDRKSEIYLSEEAQIPSIGGVQKLDAYMKITEIMEGHSIMLWINIDGTFVNSQGDTTQFSKAKEFLQDFAFKITKESLEQEIEDLEKKVKRLESDMKRLVRDNETYHKDIITAQEKIAKRESDIEKNNAEQTDKSAEINTQSDLLKLMKDKLSSHILKKN